MPPTIHPSATPYTIPLADLQSQFPSKRLVIGAAVVSPTQPRKILIVRRAASESEFAGLYELPGGESEDEDKSLTRPASSCPVGNDRLPDQLPVRVMAAA